MFTDQLGQDVRIQGFLYLIGLVDGIDVSGDTDGAASVTAIDRRISASAIDLRHLDVEVDALPGPCELVCANLISGLLMECASELVRSAGRWLAMTGIREVEADGVAGVYAARGGIERVRDGDGEWVGMLLEFE